MKKLQGFAAISKKRQREIASAGGKAAHLTGKAHEFTPAEARAASQKSIEVRRARKATR